MCISTFYTQGTILVAENPRTICVENESTMRGLDANAHFPLHTASVPGSFSVLLSLSYSLMLCLILL